MSPWAWCAWTHYQLRLSILCPFHSVQYPRILPLRQKMGKWDRKAYAFNKHPAQFIISVASRPTHRVISQCGVRLCIPKRVAGHRFLDLRLLNHIGLFSFSSSSLDIRWPHHFTFLSSSVTNEVSGTRCFLESSSKTPCSNSKQKGLSLNHISLPIYFIFVNFQWVSSHWQGGTEVKCVFIYLFNKHFWSLASSDWCSK